MTKSTATALELFGNARHTMGRFWAIWLAMALSIAAMIIATITGLERLWESWSDYPYNHAFAIFGMSAWLAIDAIRNTRLESVSPSAVGALSLLLSLSIYVLFEHSDFTMGMQALFPLILLATMATIVGISAATCLAIPVLFLYFSIPVWDLLIPPLQAVTTTVVGASLRWTGVTAFIDDNLIHVAAGTFKIAEECAGIRYFIVSFALATFYGLLYLRTWARSVALIGVALATAVLCNWIRVYSLVVIGDLTEMQHYFVAVNHSRFGWGFYAVSLIPVFAFAAFLEGRKKEKQTRQSASVTKLSSPICYLATAGVVSALFAASSFLRL